jgi:hypothetical protein
MSLELWLPPSARPKQRCPVPDCGKPFFDGEDRAFDRHVRKCINDNADKLRGMAAAGDPERALGDGWVGDEEFEDWVRRMGRVK